MSSVDQLVARIQRGEKTKAELYQSIYKLLYFICQRYRLYAAKKGYEIDDLVSVSWIGVEKAIQTYRIEKEASFTFYMVYYIKRSLAAFLGFRKGDPLVLSLDEPIPGMEDLTYGDAIEDDQSSTAFEEIENADMYSKIEQLALESLPENEREVVSKRYFNNQSFKAIAQERNITVERVRQIHNHFMRKIRANKTIRDFWREEFLPIPVM